MYTIPNFIRFMFCVHKGFSVLRTTEQRNRWHEINYSYNVKRG